MIQRLLNWYYRRLERKLQIRAAEELLDEAIERVHTMERAHDQSVLDGKWNPGDGALLRIEAANNMVLHARRALRKVRDGR